MAARLTAQEVAERAAHPVALVERLVEHGIRTPDAERRFDPTDAHLVRLMAAFEESGISLDHAARGFASGDLTYSGMGAYFTEPELYAGTFGELAERVGRPFDLVARLVSAFGLPQPHPADPGRPGGGRGRRPRARPAERGACRAPGRDYFGRTVNVAARIADYARPGEVLVSDDAARAVDRAGVEFRPVGPVALKGVRESVTLATALRA